MCDTRLALLEGVAMEYPDARSRGAARLCRRDHDESYFSGFLYMVMFDLYGCPAAAYVALCGSLLVIMLASIDSS